MIEIQALTPKRPSLLKYVEIAAFTRLDYGNIEDNIQQVHNYQLKRLLEYQTYNIVQLVTTGSN
jgi:hypothetical protein